jgi:PEP-CTERM motif
MRRLAVAAALLALGTSSAARASEIVLFDGIETADSGTGAPLGIDPSLGKENGGLGGGLISGDILFAARAGKITITVTDLGTAASGRAGSAYQVLLDTNPLGVTSATAVDASTFSTGTFSSIVTAGFHDLGVWDFISTFQGFPSPVVPNGGFVDGDFAQANVSVLITEAPEPASWVLMGMGLVSLAMIAQRRKRAQTAI